MFWKITLRYVRCALGSLEFIMFVYKFMRKQSNWQTNCNKNFELTFHLTKDNFDAFESTFGLFYKTNFSIKTVESFEDQRLENIPKIWSFILECWKITTFSSETINLVFLMANNY